jgi:hypothetical protein
MRSQERRRGVSALMVRVPPTRVCVDDLLAAETAHRFSACDSSAASAQMPQHNPIGVVDLVGVRENSRSAASARLTAVDVMHGRPDHVAPQRFPR